MVAGVSLYETQKALRFYQDSGAGVVLHALDAFHTEVLGCLAGDGVKAASDRGMQKVIVETDSMLLKMATGGDNFALAPTGGLVHEIKATAASCFSSFDVYCPRSCNKVAHALAAKGRMCPSNADMYWEGVPPGGAGTIWHDPSIARHEIFWAVPARHKHEGGAMPRISVRQAVWRDPYFGSCLGRHGTKTAHRPICSPLFYYDS